MNKEKWLLQEIDLSWKKLWFPYFITFYFMCIATSHPNIDYLFFFCSGC